MSSITDTAKFLQAVFPDWEKHAIFAHSKVGGGMAHTRDWRHLDVTRDCYWCIAAFPDDGKTTRSLSRAQNVRALVIDDVGTKVPAALVERALGKPAAVVQTSEGNFQWTYRLSRPVAVKEWPAFLAGVERKIGAALEGRDAVHLFRLPMGFNTKPTRGGFNVQPDEGDPETEIDTAGFVPPEDPAASREHGGTLQLHDPAGLMALIPNTIETREEWGNEICHQLWALTGGSEEGLAAFNDWSSWHKSYDAAATRKYWDSIHDVTTSGRELLVRAEKLDPEGYATWMAREAAIWFDDGVEPPDVPPGPGRVQFELGSKKEILRSRVNAERGILGLDIKIRYDAFHHRMQIERDGQVKAVTDHVVMLLRVELTDVYGKDFGTAVMWDAVISLGLQNQFNPVTQMLREAEAGWDGARRLDRIGPDYFNSEDTEFVRTAFRKTMLAAVRRARRPGCKFDQILVCESPEGWDKSTAWAVLAGEGNFSDAPILGKDARAVQEELGDIWIHEIAELSGLSKAEVEHVKAFASRVNDRARPAYGRALTDQPRQSIEVGTTNAEKYLLSTTGNRRFWGCRILKRIDTEALKRDRLQLWGEAAAAESTGESLVLPERLWAVAGEEQEKRRAIDTWEIELDNLPPNLMEERNSWLYVTGLAIQEYLSGYRRQTFNSGSGRKIAEIMRRLGWESTVFKVDGKATRGYKRDKSTVSNLSANPSATENPF